MIPITWTEKIKNWQNGVVQTYPKNVKKRFFYETYVCDKNMENIYDESFIESNVLEGLHQDIYTYEDHIKKSKNKYAVAFNNLSGETRLIIPYYKKGKNFTTMKDFIDNSSPTQQKYFWKKVASELKKLLKTHDKLYVSTHGLGVSYFHLRIEPIPKYYITKKFVK